MSSALGNAMEFLGRVGIFDTVLPFLLVFTMVFAFLEKTKIYGVDKYKGEDGKIYDVPRKNLNSMTAFVIAFFVIASTQLVAIISQVTASIVLVLVLVFSFILVVGAFQKETEKGFFLEGTWKLVFEIIAFLGIAVIFLHALGWLDAIFEFFGSIWTSQAAASLIMVLVLVGFMWFIVHEQKPGAVKGEKKED